MTRRFVTLLTVLALLAGCGRSDGAARPGQGDESSYVKAHTLSQLMTAVIEPDAQSFWRSSGTVSDAEGTHELTPTSPEGWAAARTSAATVAETGNLLMMPAYSRDRGPDWIAFSQTLVHVGREAEEAAIDRDGAAMFEAGAKLGEACSACHRAYLPQERAAKLDSEQ